MGNYPGAKIKVLSLFSGIGGFDLGLGATGHFDTGAFVELNPFCRGILRKHWPTTPIYEDICSVSATPNEFDLFCGGFPCQDVSTANRRKGRLQASLLGEQSGLWFEYLRLVREAHPTWIIIENVKALLNRGMGTILSQLAALGYDAEWHIIRACDAGLPHRRERIWIIANANSKRPQGISPFPLAGLRDVQWGENCRSAQEWTRRWNSPGPVLLRSYNGIPNYVDRTRALGNAIVPQIAYYIGMAVAKAEGLE